MSPARSVVQFALAALAAVILLGVLAAAVLRHQTRDEAIREAKDLTRLAGRGIAEGGPPSYAGRKIAKFRPGGLLIVRAGGAAGMFSGIIGGWSASGERGSAPVTKEVRA